MTDAVLGVRLDFDGTEDVECVLTSNSKKGVQIVAVGFTLDDVDVTITSPLGAETIVAVEEGAVHAIVGEDFILEKVTLSGFTPGSYSVIFLR